jgi:hypothetical protein
MATGEKRFSSKGRKVQRFDDSPVPPGSWPLKLRADKAEIRKSDKSGMSYLNVPFEAVGSGDGGRDKWIFHMFHLSLKPGKDGKVMAERQDGLVAYAIGLGADFDFQQVTVKDAEGNKVSAIDAMSALKWIKNRDGEEVKAQTKIEKGRDGYGDRARISYFEEAEGAGSSGPDADEDDEESDEELEAEADETEEADADEADESDEADETDEVDEDEEEVEVKKPSKKAPPPQVKKKFKK